MPTLVVLAAGVGSRYGGSKPFEPIGPSGQTLVDYAMFDAYRAGFTRVLIVVREDHTPAYDRVTQQLPPWTDVRRVVQRIDDLPAGLVRPPGRVKPWGTVQAVLSARETLRGSFAVLNGDDFYGRRAYEIAMEACRDADLGTASVIGMPLDRTLSEHGPVTRAVCTFEHGSLTGIEELYAIARDGPAISARSGDGDTRCVSASAIVSMNFWVFPVGVLDLLASCFERFLQHARDLDAELPLPDAVGDLVSMRRLAVRVRETPGPWFGLTHSADRPRLASALADFVARREYPHALWRP